MFLLSQGSSLDTVDNLPVSDIKDIWIGMSSGLVGPYKDYILTFPLYQQDPKKKKTFEEVFPDINDFMRLKDSKNLTQQEIAKNAASAMLGMRGADGAPAWLKKAMNGG